MKPKNVHRLGKRRARKNRMALNLKTAREAIGEISPGCEIFGLTKGDISLISVIEHLLDQTGPAEIVISTWTAAVADIEIAKKFLVNDRINKIEFLVDQSFRTRQPEYCALLVRTFGPLAVRFSRSHCKFVVITNDRWNLVIRTSMNLNENRRIENFEISDDAGFAAFLLGLRDEIFGKPHEFCEEDFHSLGLASEDDEFGAIRAWA